jgi:hypothetical protein
MVKRSARGAVGGGRFPDEIFAARKARAVPYEFVLDELAPVEPYTRPMFGATAVYVGEKIVLILFEHAAHPGDSGVWLATSKEHHEALRGEFPAMRSIAALGSGTTNWQVLPATAPDFEDAVLRACGLVVAGDPRVGRVPASRSRKKSARGAAVEKPRAPAASRRGAAGGRTRKK